MRFPPHILDDIRARIPVSDIVGRAVSWDRRKSVPSRGDYWACCPFHGEKTPSFHADNRKGRYHCFGCGQSGDIFTFLTEKEGLSFPEAVERLAEQAGVALPRAEPGAQAREEARKSLYEVLEAAARFYEDQLQQRAGAHARGYIADRGLSPATIGRFRLGYAPSGRYGLKEHLGQLGIDAGQMTGAGLLISGEDIAVPFDRFRDRLMFPITDLRGRVVGFGGRALSAEAKAKYLNSPETELFHKRTLLYNANSARASAHEQGAVIAVEGYMDVIALVQAGFANVVAPLGTALTAEQIQLLWRLADEPVLCFDGDAAGVKAAWRAADEALALLSPGKSLSFALLPEGMDPDDLVRDQGRAAMERALEQALPLVDMIWQRELEGQDLATPERRAALERRFGELVRQIGDGAVRRHYGGAIKSRLQALWQPAGGARPASGGRRGG
ncbi:MAG: DNA primase, partial [Rhodobiaceae bacterium]|nr:DNA primase [Rhodobiaceae bacterium]